MSSLTWEMVPAPSVTSQRKWSGPIQTGEWMDVSHLWGLTAIKTSELFIWNVVKKNKKKHFCRQTYHTCIFFLSPHWKVIQKKIYFCIRIVLRLSQSICASHALFKQSTLTWFMATFITQLNITNSSVDSYSSDCFNKLPYLLFIYRRSAAPTAQLHEANLKAAVIKFQDLKKKGGKELCGLEDNIKNIKTSRTCQVPAADIFTIRCELPQESF